jgi:hypothetical protein
MICLPMWNGPSMLVAAEAVFKAELEKLLRRKVACPRIGICSWAGRESVWV